MKTLQKLIDQIKDSTVEKYSTKNSVVENYDLHRRQLDKLKQLEELSLQLTSTIQQKYTEVMNDKAEHLLTLYQPEQRSPEWFEMRKGMLTASDIGSILGINKYSSINQIIKKKCGAAAPFRGNRYTFHGQKYEEIACQIYQNRYNKIVKEYGLIQHPHIKVLGASPDGISTDGIMLEIKVPSSRKITGEIPPQYYAQMQAQLQVCDLDRCDFFECNIDEYHNEEEFLDDTFNEEDLDFLDILPKEVDPKFINLPNDRKTSYGLEKGVIGMYTVPVDGEDDEQKYIYPSFELSAQEQIDYLNNHKIHTRKIYWKLVFSSLNIVDRSKQWWDEEHQVEQKLNECWKKIEEGRKNGIETVVKMSRKKATPKKKVEKKPPTKVVDGFGFLSDDEKPVVVKKKVVKSQKLDSFAFIGIEPPKEIKKVKKVKKVKKIIKKVVKKKKAVSAEVDPDNEVTDLGGCGFLD